MKFRTTVIVLIVILILCVLGLIINYNGFVKSEKEVEEAKAQIEVAYQRKIDLIPNLVEVVKGYAKHERETFVAVSEARSSAKEALDSVAGKKDFTKEDLKMLNDSQSKLNVSLMPLFAVVERYPDLKSQASFLSLQDQLEGTENRIAVARNRYNHDVKIYNIKISAFPGNILACLFGFSKKDSFESSAATTGETVKVEF
ncbi:LemA family protein [bacterium]|jgi:LemA protein|nr:LemA family protein [bacterium]